MILRDTILKILEESVQAPSGENAQPWRFGIRKNRIYVFNIPDRDQSPYNFRQRASYVANGALIENISIVSSALGCAAEIELFPDKNDPELVAIIVLNKSEPGNEPLYPFIPLRTTNRKPYKAKPLNEHEKNAIQGSAGAFRGVRVLLTEKRHEIVELAHVGSMNERLVFMNRFLHDFLFSHINWNDVQNVEKKIGFDIKTLELPPPARVGFTIFKHWFAANLLRPLGLPKAIWKQNGKGYAAAAGVGIITVPGNRNEDFVAAGRATQRLWLTVAKLGLSMQPMTGILFFMQRILADVNEPFTGEQVELIKASYEKVRAIFHLKDETIPMMFRIGHADPPTARSLKLPPIIADLA